MPANELGHEVPQEVAQRAQQQGCLGGIRFVYRDGDYGDKHPMASIGCKMARRFGSTNYQNYKVPLADGWIAFRSPGAGARRRPPIRNNLSNRCKKTRSKRMRFSTKSSA